MLLVAVPTGKVRGWAAIFSILPNLSLQKKVYATKYLFMKRIFSGVALLFVAILFFQCQRELSHIGGPEGRPAVPDPINAIVQGNVVDENGQPEAGVLVKVGTQTTTTDSKGYFRIRNATLDKYTSLVTAEKAGYYKAYRTFAATSGTNQVAIKLIPKTLTGTVDASTGGAVTLSNGAKVSLPANGIVKASGGAHSGAVNVYASYIDPTASDIAERVPGSFIADDKNGTRVMLSSFGMMAVELESASGEKLQIKNGSKATISAPIPASIQSSAPATIPLWYVDETTGVWKEEGAGTRQGNTYVGEVSHFSFWNWDISIPAINLSMTVMNHGVPVVHAKVRITRTSMTTGLTQSYGWTDSLGGVSGLVPANENLLLEVLDPCNSPLYSQNIGPFATNTNLGTITITPAGSSLITFKGKLLNCTNAAVTDGFAIITYNNTVRYARVNGQGEFSTTFTRCSSSPNTADVLGVDAGSGQQAPNPTSVNITGATTDAGNISACGTATTQFINYTIDGTAYNLTAPADSLVAYSSPDSTTAQLRTTFQGMRLSGGTVSQYFNLSFNQANTAAGTYPATSFSTQAYPQPLLVQPFNVVITSYPASVGQFYEGSFSGSFTSGGTSHTASGSFRIRRNF